MKKNPLAQFILLFFVFSLTTWVYPQAFDAENESTEKIPLNRKNDKAQNFDLMGNKEKDAKWQSDPLDTDELPFPPPKIDKRKNIFGDKTKKDSILSNMEYQVGFIAEGGSFNNGDLRRLNESNQSAINDTDDRIHLVYSRLFLNFYFPLSDSLYFRFDVFKNGFWGGDNLSGASTNNNAASTPVGADPFAFGELYLEDVLLSSKVADLSARIGRQFFEIGGGIPNDYYLRDYLDSITLTYSDGRLGRFRFLVVDFFQMAGDATMHVNYVRYFSHDNRRVRNFDGDVNTIRSGMVYESRNLLNWKLAGTSAHELIGRMYGFYARYGAVRSTGSDRSNMGSTANFADNDYAIMGGTRIIYSMPLPFAKIKVHSDVAISTGINRRLPTAAGESQDVDTDGMSFSGGLVFSEMGNKKVLGYEFLADAFYASGPKYNASGAQTSHGFVSFKGNHIGGLLANRYWGVHPSAYVASNGIDNYEHNYDRKSGTLAAHAGVGFYFLEKFRIGFDWWWFMDTGKSELWEKAAENGTTNNITNNVLRAQERLGKTLGNEFDITLEYNHNEFWSIYLRGAMLMPGSYYSTPGIRPDSPYGQDSFTGFQFGSRLVI